MLAGMSLGMSVMAPCDTCQEPHTPKVPSLQSPDVDVYVRGKRAQACSLFTRVFNTAKLV